MAKPETHTIVVSATTENPHPLTISSGTSSSTTEDGDKNFTTKVNVGDTVIWKIAEGCDITSIKTVQETFPSKNNNNLFSETPSIGDSTTKTGKIGGFYAKNKAHEQYTIYYNVSGATLPPGNPYSQDPRLQMKN